MPLAEVQLLNLVNYWIDDYNYDDDDDDVDDVIENVSISWT